MVPLVCISIVSPPVHVGILHFLDQLQVFVMDTATFPFYPAEIYHQFHDDTSEKYGKEYNALRRQYYEEGKLMETDCPGGLL